MLFWLLCACTADDDAEKQSVAGSPSAESDIIEIGSAAAGEMKPGVAPASPDEPDAAALHAAETARSVTLSVEDNPAVLIRELQTLTWDAGADGSTTASDLLRRLRLQGADALIPIRDFLLDEHNSGKLPPGLKQALLSVLLSLGLPEVEDIALQLLAGEPAAPEVLQLGLYLEMVEPGKYSDTILLAAEQALIDADPAAVLSAEFFQLVGALGTAETAALLAEMPAYHEAYASLALASIPEGSGLAALEQDARIFAAGRDTMQGRLAIQLLAQLAPQFPGAASALLDLAGQGAIPNDVWPYVLDIVAGDWEWTLLEPDSGDRVGSHTFYSPQGNQVIYRSARLREEAGEGMYGERLDLLDRLRPLVPSELGIDVGG